MRAIRTPRLPSLIGITMFGLGTNELLIFLVVAMLLFGSARLPSLMRNLGRSATEFKKGMRDDDSDDKDDSDTKNLPK